MRADNSALIIWNAYSVAPYPQKRNLDLARVRLCTLPSVGTACFAAICHTLRVPELYRKRVAPYPQKRNLDLARVRLCTLPSVGTACFAAICHTLRVPELYRKRVAPYPQKRNLDLIFTAIKDTKLSLRSACYLAKSNETKCSEAIS